MGLFRICSFSGCYCVFGVEVVFRRIEDPDIDREIVKQGGLYEYVKLAYPYVDPSPFIDGRLIQEICVHLEAVTAGEIKRLLINVPPGFMKSLLTCVFWPTWVWGPKRDVKHKWIFASYDKTLCYRDAERSLDLLQNPWFIERWGDVLWDSKKPAVGDIHTKVETRDGHVMRAGWRFATSVLGKATGRHANTQVVDDPHKPSSLLVSDKALKTSHNWLDQTMSTRAENPEDLARVIIMQRLHEADLSGYCKERGYVHLRLPMRFEKKFVSTTPVGGDWRTVDSELLWPERCSAGGVKILEAELKTEQAIACQLQQRPIPQGGLIFKEDWFRFWHPDGPKKLDPNGRPCLLLPIRGGIKSQSWDLRFAKEADEGQSRVCGQLWWYHAPYHYLLGSDVGFYGFWDSIEAIRRMSKDWPGALAKLIEKKANGFAAEETLSKEISGIELVEPKGGKLVRCFACQPTVKSGHVVIPHPDMPGFDWVKRENGFLSEVCGFPNAAFDDQPDAMSQHLNWTDGWTSKFLSGMKQAQA